MKTLQVESVEPGYCEVVRINAPDIFKDEDFIEWLNGEDSSTATWHRRGGSPGEYSDCFFWFDDEGHEGSDTDMPEHIWNLIGEAVRKEGLHSGIVWLSNLG